MTAQDFAAIAVAIITVLGGVAAYVQFMIKHYLSELKPNSGSSMRDEITAINARVNTIIELLGK